MILLAASQRTCHDPSKCAGMMSFCAFSSLTSHTSRRSVFFLNAPRRQFPLGAAAHIVRYSSLSAQWHSFRCLFSRLPIREPSWQRHYTRQAPHRNYGNSLLRAIHQVPCRYPSQPYAIKSFFEKDEWESFIISLIMYLVLLALF